MITARALARRAVSAAAYYSGLEGQRHRVAMQDRGVVLMYHRVLPDAPHPGVDPGMFVTASAFEHHLRLLRSRYDLVTIDAFGEWMTGQRVLTRPPCAITFDDGWRDNYTMALPVLREARVPATVFLVSEATEHDRLFWPEDVVTKTHHVAQRQGPALALNALADLWPDSQARPSVSAPGTFCEHWVEALKLIAEDERRSRINDYLRRIGVSVEPLIGYIMTWDQAREMSAYGIAFGSHTHTHKILEGLDETEAMSELTVSRSIISNELQCDVDLFCYPNARYTGSEGALLARCGYRYGFIIDGRQVGRAIDPFYVPRFLMSEEVARNRDYVSLHLLEAPLYAGRPHRPRSTMQPAGVS